jgi:SET domain-containing protein
MFYKLFNNYQFLIKIKLKYSIIVMSKANKLVNNDLVYIKKSKIEGLGVFAKNNITKGTKIADYYGKEMKWKTFKNKYGDYKLNSLHTYPMRRIWKIIVAKEEPYKSKNLTNYINEIRGKSNCELKLRALYAKKDIKKGHELLLDYPEDYNRFWLNKTKTKTRKNKK